MTTTYRLVGTVYLALVVSRYIHAPAAIPQQTPRSLLSKEIVSDPQGSRHGTDRKNPAAYWKSNPNLPTPSQAW
jgi:hypothetical protein